MTDKLITIREEKDYDKIIDEIDEILVKNNLTYVETFGILRLLELNTSNQLNEENENEE